MVAGRGGGEITLKYVTWAMYDLLLGKTSPVSQTLFLLQRQRRRKPRKRALTLGRKFPFFTLFHFRPSSESGFFIKSSIASCKVEPKAFFYFFKNY